MAEIRGTARDDRLVGTWRADKLDGYGGNDTLHGGRGNDLLRGGMGNDMLDGQSGDDRLIGGDGADSFLLDGRFGNDVILDFTAADRLVTRTPLPAANGFVLAEDGMLDLAGGNVDLGEVAALQLAGRTADGGYAYAAAEPAANPAPTPTPSPAGGDLAAQLALIEINAIRADAGLQPLALQTDLTEAALAHVEDMAAKDYFSHASADGRSPGDRLEDAGYPHGTWGENIAMGYPDWDAAIEGWMNSPGHKENILRGIFDESGLGEAERYYVHDFGGNARDAYITGLAFDDQDGDGGFDPGEGLSGAAIRVAGGNGQVATLNAMESGWFQGAFAPGTYEVGFADGGTAQQVTLGTQNVFVGLGLDIA